MTRRFEIVYVLLPHRRIKGPFAIVSNGTVRIRLLALTMSLAHVPHSNVDSTITPSALSIT